MRDSSTLRDVEASAETGRIDKLAGEKIAWIAFPTIQLICRSRGASSKFLRMGVTLVTSWNH